MNRVKEELERRKEELLQLKNEKEHALKGVPKGTVRISCSQNRTQFYYREKKEDRRGNYIPEKELELVKKLAQKEYDQKVLRAVEKELGIVERCMAHYQVTEPEMIYENLHEERKKLIIPIRESDEGYIKKWEAVKYQGKGFDENMPEYYTVKKERVRSKSELIIADLLAREGVPYRYESPLHLKGFGQIYPDFMVLNVAKRKEFYWEHLGMMDDPAYVEKAIQKITMYEQNGIYPGERLILTYETRKNPLSQKVVIRMIEHYLKG